MSQKQVWTGIAVVAGSLLVTGTAALVIEDSGRNPYRTYQKTGTLPDRPEPKHVDPADDWDNIFPGPRNGPLR
jgi:hypothetical protein